MIKNNAALEWTILVATRMMLLLQLYYVMVKLVKSNVTKGRCK